MVTNGELETARPIAERNLMIDVDRVNMYLEVVTTLHHVCNTTRPISGLIMPSTYVAHRGRTDIFSPASEQDARKTYTWI